MNIEILLIIFSIITTIILSVSIFLLIKLKLEQTKLKFNEKLDYLYNEIKQQKQSQEQSLRTEVLGTIITLDDAQRQTLENVSTKFDNFSQYIYSQFDGLKNQFQSIIVQSYQNINQNLKDIGDYISKNLIINLEKISQDQLQQLKQIYIELEKNSNIIGVRLHEIQTNNEFSLEQIRKIVNEKLQNTLQLRLGESFTQIREYLDTVNQSIVEMMVLAKGLDAGVSGLQRILSGVKTKGIWGEIQLGSLLEQVIPPEMYAKNVEIKPGSGQRVEFAAKIPSYDDQSVIWLPIDAKFPYDQYERLVQAAEISDPNGVETASRAIEGFVRNAAKEINIKYINPPYSTDFAIMFLPTEGLYAEILRRPGLIEALQREYQVVPVGPTTLYAVLNSFQMGFRTIAIQRKSGEVWHTLNEIKNEFLKFSESIDKVRKKLYEADKHLDNVAVRSRAIDRKLKGIEKFSDNKKNDELPLENKITNDD